MFNTSEHQKQLTLIYSKIYKRNLEEARIIRKEMTYRCRRNYEFSLSSIIFGICPIFIAIIVALFLN